MTERKRASNVCAFVPIPVRTHGMNIWNIKQMPTVRILISLIPGSRPGSPIMPLSVWQLQFPGRRKVNQHGTMSMQVGARIIQVLFAMTVMTTRSTGSDPELWHSQRLGMHIP